MEKTRELMLRFVRSGLWGTHEDIEGQAMTHDVFESLVQLAIQQSVVGIMSQGLMNSDIHLDHKDVLRLYSLQQKIRKRNELLDEGVVRLCRKMTSLGSHILIFKGQAIAQYYPDAGLRQSGDIDFLCRAEDWDKTLAFFRENDLAINDMYTERDVSFLIGGVVFEMHNKLTVFSNPWHNRYWQDTVMPEILTSPYTVRVAGQDIPTLAPLYDVLYVFTHLFQHLISDGIGLRQFCDLALLMRKTMDHIDTSLLEKHLEGIGLKKAFIGIGALLIDHLCYPEDHFPFPIPQKEHQKVAKLLDNIFYMGNFGHNHRMKHKPGLMHALEHLRKIFRQSLKFSSYAPSETWWKIPYMFKWWGIKIGRMLRR